MAVPEKSHPMAANRIHWLDNMKAVAILLVVAGHYVDEPVARAYIYSFHMHLFFLVSGLLSASDTRRTLATVVKRRARALIVPYFIFSLLYYAFFLLRRRFGETPDLATGLSEPLVEILTFNTNWFLGVLFVVSIVFHVVAPRLRNWRSYVLLAALCTCAHYVVKTHFASHLHENLPKCLTGLVFFAAGAALREWLVGENPLAFIKRRPYVLPAVVAANLVVFRYAYLRYGLIEINFSQDYFAYYALALSAVFVVYVACRHIRPNPVMAFVGANTIVIYMMEGYPPAVVRRIMLHVFGIDNFGTINFGFACIYSVLTIVILTPFILLINRYVPWVIGRGRVVGIRAAQ